jgi:UDP-N-acetyl-D-mannosaminuronic acid dehydrogenase
VLGRSGCTLMAQSKQITVIGCGAIGLPVAVAFASRGAEVLGIDIDATQVRKLASAELDLLDEGLEEALQDSLAKGNIRFERSLPRYSGKRIFVLAVPTPVDQQNRWIRKSLDEAFNQVLSFARDQDLLVIRSTVPVGTARSLAAVAKNNNLALHVAACPDRSVAGTSFKDQFSVPHIIGGVNDRSAELAAKEFGRLGAVRLVRNAETAELLKLFANIQRDVTFALANQFAMICDELDVEFDDLVNAASDRYPRFGIARPGYVGGPCLPKDAYLLAQSTPERLDLVALPLCAREVNSGVLTHWTRIICDYIKSLSSHRAPVIAILGMAFKGEPPTRDQRGSMGQYLAANLHQQVPNAEVRTWDPESTDNKRTAFEAIENADVVIIANNHRRILDLAPIKLASMMRHGGTIFDLSGTRRKMPNYLPGGISFRCFGGGRHPQRHTHPIGQSSADEELQNCSLEG